MGTGLAQRQSCGPGGHVPRMDRILQGEIRWPPQNWDSRVPATLVPDGDAPRTQESHPSTLCGLGALNERFDSRVPLDAPPWWPPTYERPEHGHHARAERVGRVWVGLIVARIASPNVGARTCSICARVTLRRVAPCAAPEALGGPWSPGTRPLCTPGGGGRSTGRTATARAHEDPAPCTGRTRETLTAPLRAPHGAQGVTAPKPNPPMPACERDAHAGRVWGSCTACGYRPRP